MNKYAIIAPNNKVFASSDSYMDSLNKATELSLRWGALFVVKPATQEIVAFPAQRAKVMRLAHDWFKASQDHPGTAVEKRAKYLFDSAAKSLNRAIKSYEDLRYAEMQLDKVSP